LKHQSRREKLVKLKDFVGRWIFWNWEAFSVREFSLITECGLLQYLHQHSSTKYFKKFLWISLKDEVAGRWEYCEVAQFVDSSNESLAPSSSINVKGENKNYTSYSLIESLYHLTEHTAPFKIPNIKATYSHFCARGILRDVFYELQCIR